MIGLYSKCILKINTVFTGQDGNFFVYNYMSQKEVDAEVVKAKIPSAFKLTEDQKLPDDIDDPHAYRSAFYLIKFSV